MPDFQDVCSDDEESEEEEAQERPTRVTESKAEEEPVIEEVKEGTQGEEFEIENCHNEESLGPIEEALAVAFESKMKLESFIVQGRNEAEKQERRAVISGALVEVLTTLAELFCAQKQVEAASTFFSEALQLCKEMRPDDHRTLSSIYFSLGTARFELQ